MHKRGKYTKEQDELLQAIVAKMNAQLTEIMEDFEAQNTAKAMPKLPSPRLALDIPKTMTDSRYYRLPISISKNIYAMVKELNATQGYILWHLMKFACTGIRTPEYVKISESLAFKTFGDTMKD